MKYWHPMGIKALSVPFILMSVMASCGNHERLPQTENPIKQESSDPVVKANQTLARTEEQDIQSYVRRRGLEMEKTPTGIRYMVYQPGYGINPSNGDIVELDYSLSFLNGNAVYSSASSGPKVFTVGFDEKAEEGLHEIVRLLKVGDKALVIIPSAMGYGLQGDGNQIPRHATLVYDLQLKSIRKQQ